MKIPWYLMAKGKGGGGYKTASGPVVSISDALAAPLRSLVVNIEPVQDLHGYDNPWPAGGGKNLCDPSTIIVGFWDGTGAYSADVNYKTSGLIPVEPSTNYTGTFFKADKTEVNRLVYTEWDSSENFIRQSTSFDSFVTTANTAYVRVRNYNAQSSLITSNDFLYQVEKGSATAYAPYSNICPISGWSAVNVWVQPTHDTSANPTVTIQLGQTVYGGTLDVTNGGMTVDRYLYVYDGTESFNKSSTALNGFYNNLIGITPHDWPKMWNYNLPVTPISSEISSMFKMTRNADTYRENYGYCYLDSGMNFNCDPDLFGTTVNSFKAKLAELYESGTPVSAFVKLATPITIPLTPQEISTLQGANNLWADTGDITIEYLASGGVNTDLMKLAVAFMGRK